MAQAGGCPEKQGRETGLVPCRGIPEVTERGAVSGGHFNLRLPVFPGSTTTFLQKATTQFSESVISVLDLPPGAILSPGKDSIWQRYKGRLFVAWTGGRCGEDTPENALVT